MMDSIFKINLKYETDEILKRRLIKYQESKPGIHKRHEEILELL